MLAVTNWCSVVKQKTWTWFLIKNVRSRPKTTSETHNDRTGFCCSLKPVCFGRYESSMPGKRRSDKWILDIFIYFLWRSRDILLIAKISDFVLTTSSSDSAVLALGDPDPEHHVYKKHLFGSTLSKYFDLALCVVFCKYFINNWIVRDDNVNWTEETKIMVFSLTLTKFPIQFCSKLRRSLVNGLY